MRQPRAASDVEPLDDATVPVVRGRASGMRVRARAVLRVRRGVRRGPGGARYGRLEREPAAPLAPEPFETLVTSITAQQVSLRAAIAIRNRLIDRYGACPGRARSRVPGLAMSSPAWEEDDPSRSGFSHRKAQYVRQRSRWTERRSRRARGAARRGGAVRACGRCRGSESGRSTGSSHATSRWPRAWPAGDLALRKAASRFYGARGDD